MKLDVVEFYRVKRDLFIDQSERTLRFTTASVAIPHHVIRSACRSKHSPPDRDASSRDGHDPHLGMLDFHSLV